MTAFILNINSLGKVDLPKYKEFCQLTAIRILYLNQKGAHPGVQWINMNDTVHEVCSFKIIDCSDSVINDTALGNEIIIFEFILVLLPTSIPQVLYHSWEIIELNGCKGVGALSEELIEATQYYIRHDRHHLVIYRKAVLNLNYLF